MAAPSGIGSIRTCRTFILLLCGFGLLLSAYAYYVEISKEHDSSFRAFCDISATISCSKVFTSRYGRGFGIFEHFVGKHHWVNQPNSVFGVIFYVLQVLLTLSGSSSLATLQVVLAVLSNFGSIYLGYILYFILHDFCIICVSTYVVNFLLLIFTVRRRRILVDLIAGRRSPKKTN